MIYCFIPPSILTVQKFSIRLSALLYLWDKAKTINDGWNLRGKSPEMSTWVWYVLRCWHIDISTFMIALWRSDVRVHYTLYVYFAVLAVRPSWVLYVSTIQDLGPLDRHSFYFSIFSIFSIYSICVRRHIGVSVF